MEELELDKYFEVVDNWYKHHVEYVDKVMELNKIDADETEFERLKYEYGIYAEMYETPWYTKISEEFVEKLKERGENTKNAEEILEDLKKTIGRKFFGSGLCWDKELELVGAVSTIDDYYWLGKQKDGTIEFFSCVGKLDFAD